MHSVHAEAVGPKFGGSDRPVIFRATILNRRVVDNAVTVVAENRGLGESVVMTAVTPTDLVVSADLMIEFDIELPRRSRSKG